MWLKSGDSPDVYRMMNILRVGWTWTEDLRDLCGFSGTRFSTNTDHTVLQEGIAKGLLPFNRPIWVEKNTVKVVGQPAGVQSPWPFDLIGTLVGWRSLKNQPF